MPSDELTKAIEKSHRIMEMQADICAALMESLTCIAYQKPVDPSAIAVSAIEKYRNILETFKTQNPEAAS